MQWAKDTGIERLHDIEQQRTYSTRTVELKLSAVRGLFSWLSARGILRTNPMAMIQKTTLPEKKTLTTPALPVEETRQLFLSIPTNICGLRDRALFGVMLYAVARVSAVLAMDVKDVYRKHNALWIRLYQSGGRPHNMPCHPELAAALTAYIEAADIAGDPDGPLFRAMASKSTLGKTRLTRSGARLAVYRRTANADLNIPGINTRTFRKTGLLAYFKHPDAKLETAQLMAAHKDPKSTSLYRQDNDQVRIEDVQKIRPDVEENQNTEKSIR